MLLCRAGARVHGRTARSPAGLGGLDRGRGKTADASDHVPAGQCALRSRRSSDFSRHGVARAAGAGGQGAVAGRDSRRLGEGLQLPSDGVDGPGGWPLH